MNVTLFDIVLVSHLLHKYKKRVKMDKTKNELMTENLQIVINNSFNNEVVRGLNNSEHNLLLGLLGRMKNSSTDEVIIDLNNLPDLSGLEQPSRQQVINTAESMWSKVKSTDYSPSAQYGNDSNISGSVLLFSYFSIDKKANILTLKINPYLEYFINNFTKGHYTSLEFKKFLLARNKYGKRLYRLLAQFFSTGLFRKRTAELRRLMDCPDSYDTRRFNDKILIPAMKSISELVPNLTLNKVKTGRVISHYEFRFTPQTNNKEWDPGFKLSSKKGVTKVPEIAYENNFKNDYLPGKNSPTKVFKAWLAEVNLFKDNDEYFEMRSKSKTDL